MVSTHWSVVKTNLTCLVLGSPGSKGEITDHVLPRYVQVTRIHSRHVQVTRIHFHFPYKFYAGSRLSSPAELGLEKKKGRTITESL